MSIRDVMMIQDTIHNDALAAGAGDFSRTVFERSNFNVPIPGGKSEFFILSKFITPTDGVYKISFDYQFYNAGASRTMNGVLRLYGANAPFVKSLGFYNASRVTSVEGDIKGDWYFEKSIGVGRSSSSGSNYNETLLDLTKIDNSAEWKSKTCYFQLKKGDAHIIGGDITNITNDTAANFSFRNFKITY